MMEIAVAGRGPQKADAAAARARDAPLHDARTQHAGFVPRGDDAGGGAARRAHLGRGARHAARGGARDAGTATRWRAGTADSGPGPVRGDGTGHAGGGGAALAPDSAAAVDGVVAEAGPETNVFLARSPRRVAMTPRTRALYAFGGQRRDLSLINRAVLGRSSAAARRRSWAARATPWTRA